MTKGKPTAAQVDLQLRLYDMRRETKLRAARDWFTNHFQPQSMEDVQRLAPPGSEENAYMRMAVTYWETVCALFNYDLLHEDFFFETTGEQYMFWVRVEPIAPAIREMFGDPNVFGQLEKAARRYEEWYQRRAPGALEKMRAMMNAPPTGAAQRAT